MEKQIREKALIFLSRREHSTFDIKRKLVSRLGNECSECIDLVLNDLKCKNLLSDNRFCEMLVLHRTQCLFGPIKMLSELKENKIEMHIINQYLAPENDEFWLDFAKQAVLKKMRQRHRLDKNVYIKVVRYLLSRGFTNYIAKEAALQCLKAEKIMN